MLSRFCFSRSRGLRTHCFCKVGRIGQRVYYCRARSTECFIFLFFKYYYVSNTYRAIILMFGIFSAIILVALFYFFLGLLTYSGGCAPIRGGGTGAKLINQLIETAFENELHGPNDEFTEGLKRALRNCEAEESIFEYLREANIYNVNDLDSFEAWPIKDLDAPEVNENLNSFVLLTQDEREKIAEALKGNLSSYHGVYFRTVLCDTLYFPKLKDMGNFLRNFASNLRYPRWGLVNGVWRPIQWQDPFHQIRLSFWSHGHILKKAESYFVPRLVSDKQAIRQKTEKIDKLILYNNYDFGKTVQVLVAAVVRSEEFIRSRGEDFLESVIKNLTYVIQKQYYDYVDRVITESNTRVGLCEPLAYIYFRGMKDVCDRLVNPIVSLSQY